MPKNIDDIIVSCALQTNPHITDGQYRRWYSLLLPFTKFSFRKKKFFTPGQKRAISTQWGRLSGFVADTQVGVHYRIVKLTPHQKSYLSRRYTITNRGAIMPVEGRRQVYGGAVFRRLGLWLTDRFSAAPPEDIVRVHSDFSRQGTFSFEAGRVATTVRYPHMLEMYVPAFDDEMIVELVNALITLYEPHSVHLSINKSRGTVAYTPDDWSGYEKEVLGYVNMLDPDVDSPFTGVHLSWILPKVVRVPSSKWVPKS